MKKWIALLTAALLALLVFAACGKEKPANGTEAGTSEIVTTAPETTPEESSSESTEAETSTTAPEASTTEEATIPPLPQGKKEILAAYTAVVDKVKIDRPEYKNNDWQTMTNVDMSGITYGIISPVAKGFLETYEQSTVGTQTKGNHPKWFALPTSTHKVGCVLTDTSKIESASCTKSGDYYMIKITLVQEKDPTMNLENPYATPGWHGRMFDVIDIVEVTDVAKSLGFNEKNAYCTFKGTATLKYDPATNQCVSLDHVIDVRVFLGSGSAKVIADYRFYDFKW
ncbi:MAG: hypothetical protein FWC27_15195 [Firmicutes bacterium]|nr:hypothetical protein [Bacillota bacterium]